MGSVKAEVETAFSFLELLAQAEREREELDESGDLEISDLAVAIWNETERAFLVANATWVGRLIDSDTVAFIEKALKETPLTVTRNAFASTVTLATPGVLRGLKDKAAKEKRKSSEASQGRYSRVHAETWRAMMREGLVDWSVRTAADEGYEIRNCANCGGWYEPLLRSRSRFCSAKCRKNFNNLRNSGHE